MAFFLIVGLIIGAVSVVFVLQNVSPITVTFFTWQLTGSLAVILLLALIVGMLIAVLILLPGLIKTEFQVRRLIKKNKQLEGEVVTHQKPQVSSVTEPAPVAADPVVDMDAEAKL